MELSGRLRRLSARNKGAIWIFRAAGRPISSKFGTNTGRPESGAPNVRDASEFSVLVTVLPSSWRVTSIFEAWPFMISSIELSTISQRRWW